MVSLTDPAIAEIQDYLMVHGAPRDHGARVVVTEQREIDLVIDHPSADDRVVTHDGAALIIVDARTLPVLLDLETDVAGEEGAIPSRRLILRPRSAFAAPGQATEPDTAAI